MIYFGDYIPAENEITDNLGAENQRVRPAMGLKFVECLQKHGGDAEIISLPEPGIKGNTHFLFVRGKITSNLPGCFRNGLKLKA